MRRPVSCVTSPDECGAHVKRLMRHPGRHSAHVDRNFVKFTGSEGLRC